MAEIQWPGRFGTMRKFKVSIFSLKEEGRLPSYVTVVSDLGNVNRLG